MAVRPFYMTGDIEGRSSLLTGGPKSKNGTMDITIQQRNQGSIETAFTIRSFPDTKDGKNYLLTKVMDSKGFVIATHETEY